MNCFVIEVTHTTNKHDNRYLNVEKSIKKEIGLNKTFNTHRAKCGINIPFLLTIKQFVYFSLGLEITSIVYIEGEKTC